MSYRVIVPNTRNGRISHVSYPASGCALYTRDEAIAVLRRFAERNPERGQLGHALECWAESDRERFGLHEID